MRKNSSIICIAEGTIAIVPPARPPIDQNRQAVRPGPQGHFKTPNTRDKSSSQHGPLPASNTNISHPAGEIKICWHFNHFPKADCELLNDQSSKGYIHKCNVSNRAGCNSKSHQGKQLHSQRTRSHSRVTSVAENTPRARTPQLSSTLDAQRASTYTYQ